MQHMDASIEDEAALNARLRLVPAVQRLLEEPVLRSAQERIGRNAIVAAAREILDEIRAEVRAGKEPHTGRTDPATLAKLVVQRAGSRSAGGIRRVINATGVILHTGLGRAPLPAEVFAAFERELKGYASVELELDQGKRGRRDAAVADLLTTLLPCEDATVLNNNAGATLLTLAALARGKQVIVSRGQLVEIGGSFRMPDVMAESGAKMVEVGTTNRTNVKDYERAIGPDTAMLLVVHTSNFRVIGFTEEVGIAPLAELGRRHNIPVVHDIGSGALFPEMAAELQHEPVVQQSLEEGAGLVLFSGDKILGGPQAGIAAGKTKLVQKIRGHSLFRALRPDKLALRALETTLALYLDPVRRSESIPTLRLLRRTLSELQPEAEALAARLRDANAELEIATASDASRLGSGSLPERDLPTRVVQIRHRKRAAHQLAAAMRESDPPIIARIQGGLVLIDPRTLLDGDADAIVAAAAEW